jgi:hypothetical protein
MNRRGLSIDNINRKYRGGSFVASPPASPNYLTTVASPVSMVGGPFVRRSVVRTPSPVITAVSPVSVARPIARPVVNTMVPAVRGSVLRAPSPVTIRRSVARVPSPVTVVQNLPTVIQQQPTVVQETVDRGNMIPISKKVTTVREVTIPTYQVEQQEEHNVGYTNYQPPPPIPQKSRCTCPWWLWLLLLLPLLGLLFFGLSKLFTGSKATAKRESES